MIDSHEWSHIILIHWTSESRYLLQVIQSLSSEPYLESCSRWTGKCKNYGDVDTATVDFIYAIV